MFKKLVKAVSVSLCMTLLVGNLSVLAAPKVEKLSISKSSVEMRVGESFHIKSEGDAKVKVHVSPQKASKDIIVKVKNKKIVKVKKINSRNYQVLALKKGKTVLTIQSVSNKGLSKNFRVIVKGKAKPKPMVYLNSNNFEKEVLNYKGKVVIDFGADWCYYCNLLEPIFEEARKKLPEYKFCKVDTDIEQGLAYQHGITGIPRMFVYKNGKIVKDDGYHNGMTADNLVSWLKN